eukprot:Clim_evm6s4 gene=Clim_evmTU6s4
MGTANGEKTVVSTQPTTSGQTPQAPNYDDDAVDKEWHATESNHPLALCLGLLFLPCTILCSCVCLSEREEAIVLQYGKYHKRLTEPGCHVVNPCGREVMTVTTKKITIDLPSAKVTDYNGNPIMVSAIVCYQYTDAMRALLEVENHNAFVRQNAQTVLRQTVGLYPYETADGSPSLRSDYEHVNQIMATELQKQVTRAGAKVFSFRLDEISYATEIAAQMLKKQAAAATVQARHTLVEGAVGIADDAVKKLESLGHNMTENQKADLINSIITVTCSDSDTVPTVNVGNSRQG